MSVLPWRLNIYLLDLHGFPNFVFKTICYAEPSYAASITLNKLKLDSHLPKKMLYLLQWKLFKNDEKSFLLHFKSFFRSQDIEIFVLTFWSCRKNSLIRKITLTSKFMMSQRGLQTIAISATSHEVKATRKWNLVR